MAVAGWLLDKSAAVRASDPAIASRIEELSGPLYVCPVGKLEQLYSAQSARDYDRMADDLESRFDVVEAPADIFDRVLRLQRDLARHRGLWHRMPIADLLIAEIALYHDLGVVHVDADYDRIAALRPLEALRVAARP